MQITLGSGKLGFRHNGKHLILTRGKRSRIMRFKVPKVLIDQNITLIAVQTGDQP